MSGPWIAAFGSLWLVVIASVVVELGFLRRAAVVLERVESKLEVPPAGVGAMPGETISHFQARDREGAIVSSDELARSQAVYLFLEPGCRPCKTLAAELGGNGGWLEGPPLRVVIDDSSAGRAFALPPDVEVLYQSDGAIASAFKNLATPQAYVVGEGGVVLDTVIPSSVDSVRMLVTRAKGGDRRCTAPVESKTTTEKEDHHERSRERACSSRKPHAIRAAPRQVGRRRSGRLPHRGPAGRCRGSLLPR